MSLKEVVATAKTNKTSERTTGKTPAFYAKQKQECIDEGCQSLETTVRIHFAGSSFTPANNLKAMLKVEEDKEVLSVLVQNERLPERALESWLDTPQAEMFDEDDEAYQFVQARFTGPSNGSDSE